MKTKRTIVALSFFAAAIFMLYADDSALSERATAAPGAHNISFGYGAGHAASGQNTNNVYIGTNAGAETRNCTGCFFLGVNAGRGAENVYNAVAIGAGALPHGDNTVTLGGGTVDSLEKLWIGSKNAKTLISEAFGILLEREGEDVFVVVGGVRIGRLDLVPLPQP